MSAYSEGTQVKWNWGNGEGKGEIDTVYERKVTRKIDGTEVTRNGSKDEPAYYIKQSDGDAVLKSHSEIESV